MRNVIRSNCEEFSLGHCYNHIVHLTWPFKLMIVGANVLKYSSRLYSSGSTSGKNIWECKRYKTLPRVLCKPHNGIFHLETVVMKVLNKFHYSNSHLQMRQNTITVAEHSGLNVYKNNPSYFFYDNHDSKLQEDI